MPALVALAVVAANSIAVVALSGSHTIDIAGRPDLPEGIVLALTVVLLPIAAFLGWLAARTDSVSGRVAIGALATGVIALGAIFGGPSPRISGNLVLFSTLIGIIMCLTATGLGSILGWVGKTMLANAASTTAMFVRALPVVLLTFLVFFNTHVWLMTSLISRARLWAGMIFLFLISASFLVATTLDQVRPLLADPGTVPVAVPDDPDPLAGTPFAEMPDGSDPDPLSIGERVNIVFAMAAAQLLHVLTVAMMTGMVFLVLGLILVSPEVLDAWTRGAGRRTGEFLGMTLPIPDSLIQTTMLLGALTFMYVSAKAVTDTQYRAQFVEPMLDSVRVTLLARNRYRAVRPRRSPIT